MGLKRIYRSLGLLTLALMIAGTVDATPRETHKLGVDAVNNGRWADAERFFRAAISERPQEKVNRFLNTAYVPHYYLGVALAELGRCQDALSAWAESEQQGQIQRSDLAADLGRRRKACKDLLAQIDSARKEVEQLLDRAGDASASLANLSQMPELAPLWNQGSPSFNSRQKRAAQQLTDAQQRASDQTAGGELDRLAQAKSLANSATTELNAVISDARRRLSELNAAIGAALEQLEEAEQKARRTLRSISDLAPYPRRLGSRAAALERTLKEIRESKSSASPERLTELTGQLEDSHSALRRAARRPPKELTQAVEAFLSGAYPEALTLLDVPSLSDNERTRPHVCRLRAASHHALWALGGEQDDSLRDQAAEAILACLEEVSEEEPAPEPNEPLSEKFFSPRFIEFHVATLEAQAQAELAGLEGLEELEGEAGASAIPAVEPDEASESTDATPDATPAEADTGADR